MQRLSALSAVRLGRFDRGRLTENRHGRQVGPATVLMSSPRCEERNRDCRQGPMLSLPRRFDHLPVATDFSFLVVVAKFGVAMTVTDTWGAIVAVVTDAAIEQVNFVDSPVVAAVGTP